MAGLDTWTMFFLINSMLEDYLEDLKKAAFIEGDIFKNSQPKLSRMKFAEFELLLKQTKPKIMAY
jgi:hypothetical protein